MYTKPRPQPTTRSLLITMAITSTATALLLFGSANVVTLFLLGPPFHFDSVTIGNFIALQSIIQSITSTLLVKLLEQCGLSGLTIVLISVASAGLGQLTLGLANSTALLYTRRYMYLPAVQYSTAIHLFTKLHPRNIFNFMSRIPKYQIPNTQRNILNITPNSVLIECFTFLDVAVTCFGTALPPVARSIMSQNVTPEEQGINAT